MYNFNAHTLNGLPVNYSQIPNFALDTVETDKGLNANAKLVYIRLLRYATLVKKTSFKITASWLSDNLALDRHTVGRALKSLKESGYLNDDGIVLIAGSRLDSPITLVNDTAIVARSMAQNAPTPQPQFDDVDLVRNAQDDIFKTLGIRRKTTATSEQKGTPDTVEMGQNAPLTSVAECTISPKNDVAKCTIDQNSTVQNAPLSGANCTSEWHRMHHPIKNKEENKEKKDYTEAKNQNATATSRGDIDALAEVSNRYKAESVTNLVTVTNGKLTINPNFAQH
jgi:hypothetical protein